MLDPNFIRENTQAVRHGMQRRGMDAGIVDHFMTADSKWLAVLSDIEKIRAEKNKLGKDNIIKAKELKINEKKREEELKKIVEERFGVLEKIPNVPESSVPDGSGDENNEELSRWGDLPKFDFAPRDYLELAGDLIDTERAARVSGTRFGYLLGDVALLEFAVVKYAFDVLVKKGFVPVVPPVLIKTQPMKAMGKTKFIADGDAYRIEGDDLYLVGTAEDTIGPFHMGEKFGKGDLPKRYAGFSTAFRREAGSYGKDTKGILRVHQFDKVEMFAFTDPQSSVKENDFLLETQEELMQGLDLPYRVVRTCPGEIGFTATNQYDIEAWVPSEGKYRETHSCSNTTNFQSGGLNIRNADGEYVHMLNATAFAIGRTLIAIIENNQTKDGSIKIPKALQDYVGKNKIKAAPGS